MLYNYNLNQSTNVWRLLLFPVVLSSRWSLALACIRRRYNVSTRQKMKDHVIATVYYALWLSAASSITGFLSGRSMDGLLEYTGI